MGALTRHPGTYLVGFSETPPEEDQIEGVLLKTDVFFVGHPMPRVLAETVNGEPTGRMWVEI